MIFHEIERALQYLVCAGHTVFDVALPQFQDHLFRPSKQRVQVDQRHHPINQTIANQIIGVDCD